MPEYVQATGTLAPSSFVPFVNSQILRPINAKGCLCFASLLLLLLVYVNSCLGLCIRRNHSFAFLLSLSG